MTLLSIVSDALDGISSIRVPTTIVGNSDPTAKTCLRLVNKLGRGLMRDYDWQELKVDYTFSTVASTASYAFPTDFKRFSPLTFWDRTDRWPLLGPASDVEWQTLEGRLNPGGSRFWYRILENKITFFPTPQSIVTIAFTYQSKNWCQSSSGDGTPNGANAQAAFAADTDTALLDEELLTLGLEYEFRAAKGLPSQAALDEYNDALADLKSADQPGAMIDFGGSDFMRRSRWPLLPDGNFG